MDALAQVSHPKPNAELIYETFNAYARHHPWLQSESIRPKAIAAELIEHFMSFSDYVKAYGLSRAEGVLLRYLSDAYKTLMQTVPSAFWSDELIDAAGFLRAALERVDASLLAEWERLLDPDAGAELDAETLGRVHELLADPRMLRSQIRSELHLLVKALATGDYEQAAESVRSDPGEPWTAERFERALQPFLQRHGALLCDHRARQAQWTILDSLESRLLRVRQVLLDPEDDNTVFIEARVDLRDGMPDGPLLEMVELGE
jgi:hypothetical protein